MKNGDSIHRLLARYAPVGLAVLIGRRVVKWDPVSATAPRTPLTFSNPIQRNSEPLLVFLSEVRKVVPAGATVSVLNGGAAPLEWPAGATYLFAVGQLPDQVVLTRTALGFTDRAKLPQWLGTFGGAPVDARYTPVASFSGGVLSRLSPSP
jgi:hypothetical protein